MVSKAITYRFKHSYDRMNAMSAVRTGHLELLDFLALQRVHVPKAVMIQFLDSDDVTHDHDYIEVRGLRVVWIRFDRNEGDLRACLLGDKREGLGRTTCYRPVQGGLRQALRKAILASLERPGRSRSWTPKRVIPIRRSIRINQPGLEDYR